MFYTEKKLEDNQICLRREIIKMLLAALPFLAVCVVGFAARNQTVCTIGLVLACAAVILSVICLSRLSCDTGSFCAIYSAG